MKFLPPAPEPIQEPKNMGDVVSLEETWNGDEYWLCWYDKDGNKHLLEHRKNVRFPFYLPRVNKS